MIRKFVVSACLFVSAFFSFAQTPSIRLGVLKGISCTPCAYLIENKEKLAVQNMEFSIFDSEQSELPKLLRGELDMGFLSPENAAKVFSEGNGALVIVGVVQNGNAVLLTSDENYQSLEDLRGKKVLVPNGGDSSVFVFRSVLAKKGLDSLASENAVLFDSSVPLAHIANKLILGEEKYALLSEPFASVAMKYSKNLRRVETVQKLYSESESGSNYPAFFLVACAEFVQENRDLVRRFIDVYRIAVQWTNRNPSKAALLSEKHNLGLSEGIVRDSLPNAALVWREANAAKIDIENYFSILLEKNPSSIGSALPDEGFYFVR